MLEIAGRFVVDPVKFERVLREVGARSRPRSRSRSNRAGCYRMKQRTPSRPRFDFHQPGMEDAEMKANESRAGDVVTAAPGGNFASVSVVAGSAGSWS